MQSFVTQNREVSFNISAQHYHTFVYDIIIIRGRLSYALVKLVELVNVSF